jgi:dTDP-4-dehydrorhamnose reductase
MGVERKIHLGGSKRISRHEFAVLAAAVFEYRNPRITACSQKDVPMPAARPPDVSLANVKAIGLGFKSPPLRKEFESMLERFSTAAILP